MQNLSFSTRLAGMGLIISCLILSNLWGTIDQAIANPAVTVSGSNLSGGNISFPAFPTITLDGSQKSSIASWSIANVTDARGNGSGWNLSITLTPFAEFDPTTSTYVIGGKTLTAGSVLVSTVPVISLADATSSNQSGMTVVSANTPLDTGLPIKIVSAPAIKGMGSYSFSSLGATLTIPANTYAATYRSDATVTLSSGP